MNINSDSAALGGLGAKLDWNNMNFWAADFAVIHLGTDIRGLSGYQELKPKTPTKRPGPKTRGAFFVLKEFGVI